MSLRIIAGKFKGHALKTPKGPSTRPTQAMLREALFNICQNSIEGAHFLDLFAGSGAMGLEALSRGAISCTFIERDRSAAQCIKENIAALGVGSNAVLYPLDYRSALKQIEKAQQRFDIIYVDPPYDLPLPPILEELLSHNLLNLGSLLFGEQRYTPNPPAPPRNLKCVGSRRFGDALLQQYSLST